MQAVWPRLVLLAACAIPLILAFALYAPSLAFDYVWDDRVLFVDSSTLRLGDISWANLTRPLFENSVYVRPSTLLSFMVQFRWLGSASEISHAISVALFLINVALVMTLTWIHCSRRSLHARQWRTLVAGVVYALHPAMVESVAWASGRFDLLATTCVLAALTADLGIKSVPLRAAAVAIAFGLGLGAKEVAVALPLLLLAQRAALDRPTVGLIRYAKGLLRRERLTALLCMLVAAVYILVRMGATSRLVPPVSVSESLTSASMRLAYVFDTLGFYLQQGLAPWWGESLPLHPAEAAAVLSPFRLPRIVMGFAFAIAVVLGLMRRYYAGWMMACAVACLLPVLNIVILPLAGNIGFDRFLTLPLVFAALAVAGIDLSRSRLQAIATNGVLTVLLALWVIGSVLMVRATLPRWANNVALWSWLHENPSTQRAAEWNLVVAAMRADRYDLAFGVLNRRLEQGPLEAHQQAVYGLALAHCGDPQEGIAYISGAMRAYPPTSYAPLDWQKERGAAALFRDRLGYAHYAMAETMVLSGMTRQALGAAEEAARYRPGMLEALVMRSALRKVLRVPDPDAATVREALAKAYPEERRRLERRERMIQAGEQPRSPCR